MISIPPSVWLFCACAVFALVARISVEGLESGNTALERLPLVSLVLVSCLASAVALYFGESDEQQVVPQMIQAFLVGQLVMAGWIDRQTTWVPDSVLLMVLTVSSAFVFTHGTEPTTVLRLVEGVGAQSVAGFLGQRPTVFLIVLSLTAGFAIWLVLVLLWGLQTLVRKDFSNPEAVKEGREHLGLDANSPAIAVLSLMFSILAVVIVALVPLQSALGDLFSCSDPGFAGHFICP